MILLEIMEKIPDLILLSPMAVVAAVLTQERLQKTEVLAVAVVAMKDLEHRRVDLEIHLLQLLHKVIMVELVGQDLQDILDQVEEEVPAELEVVMLLQQEEPEVLVFLLV